MVVVVIGAGGGGTGECGRDGGRPPARQPDLQAIIFPKSQTLLATAEFETAVICRFCIGKTSNKILLNLNHKIDLYVQLKRLVLTKHKGNCDESA